MTTSKQDKVRDIALDVAKGMCIVLMVVAHSGCPEWLGRFIYMFHMPCFFFISGILLSDRYIDDIGSGIRKKLKGYYRPFVKWTLVFLLLHNVFAYIHIYGTYYTWRDIAIKILRAFTMTGSEQLLGGYWFLISLTWASIGSILVLSLLKSRARLTNICMGGVVALVILVASVESLIPIWIPSQFGPQTVLALAFFMSGYIYRKSGWSRSEAIPWLCVPLLSVPAGTSVFCSLSMSSAQSLSWLYYVVALSGTVGLIQVARNLQYGWIVGLFSYIGDKTLYILTFHFLSFKSVSYVWIKMHGSPISDLSQFPVLKEVGSWMWVPYSIAGVALPLLLWELFHMPVMTRKTRLLPCAGRMARTMVRNLLKR